MRSRLTDKQRRELRKLGRARARSHEKAEADLRAVLVYADTIDDPNIKELAELTGVSRATFHRRRKDTHGRKH